jgi:hypothetical protein
LKIPDSPERHAVLRANSKRNVVPTPEAGSKRSSVPNREVSPTVYPLHDSYSPYVSIFAQRKGGEHILFSLFVVKQIAFQDTFDSPIDEQRFFFFAVRIKRSHQSANPVINCTQTTKP